MSASGAIYAWRLDGRGGGCRLDEAALQDWQPADGVLWIHLDYTASASQTWLRERSGLAGAVVEALLAEDTRPRVQSVGQGLMLALRGVNLNPGADPEDMVAVRVWADATRIVSTRRRRLMSAQTLDAALAAGDGPRTPGEFLVQLAAGLVSRMRDTIDAAEDRVSAIEETLVAGADQTLRAQLSELRRESIALRRYLAPQRDAMLQLQLERAAWLSDGDRFGVREVTDHLMRYLEDLDSVRDRAAVMHEELANHLAEQLNRRMYVLSLVAAFFLPLGFLTGLLGINVAGIPGADTPNAFWIVLALLSLVVAAQIWLFQRKHWL